MNLDALFPKARFKPMGISQIVPDVYATRSMKRNPWIHHPRPAATITKPDSDYQFQTWHGIRKPTISEIAMLGSYPRHVRWNDDAWARIGNSVPPLFMRAIAGQIAYAMFGGTEPVQTLRTIPDYPAHLEAAWLQHLEPREPYAPTVISSFAGESGSSLGYSSAGYCELWGG